MITPCEEIVLVLCTPYNEGTESPTAAQWEQRDRDMRMMRNNFYPPGVVGFQTRRINRPPTVIPFRQPHRWPRQHADAFKVLGPQSSLGGFVSATLNFSAEKSRSNYQAGVRVARLALESGMFAETQATSPTRLSKVEAADDPSDAADPE